MSDDTLPEKLEQTMEVNENPTRLSLPLEDESVAQVRSGEWLQLQGSLLLLSWRAAEKLANDLVAGTELPFDITNQTFYLTSPTVAPTDKVIGSIGPNDMGRYLPFLRPLLDAGARGLIARGRPEQDILERLKKKQGLYLVTVGGALLARKVYQMDVLAYPELGLDSLQRVKIAKFPAVVAIDAFGRNLFSGRTSSSNTETQAMTAFSMLEQEE